MMLNKSDKNSISAFLNEENVFFERYDYDYKFEDMQMCKNAETQIKAKIFKNLFLQNRQGTEFFLLLMSGEKRFKTADVSKQINKSRLSFSTDDKLYELLGVYPGSITPLGLLFDKECKVTVLIDKDLYQEEYVGLHPLENDSLVRMRFSDIVEQIILKTGHKIIDVEINTYFE